MNSFGSVCVYSTNSFVNVPYKCRFEISSLENINVEILKVYLLSFSSHEFFVKKSADFD